MLNAFVLVDGVDPENLAWEDFEELAIMGRVREVTEEPPGLLIRRKGSGAIRKAAAVPTHRPKVTKGRPPRAALTEEIVLTPLASSSRPDGRKAKAPTPRNLKGARKHYCEVKENKNETSRGDGQRTGAYQNKAGVDARRQAC